MTRHDRLAEMERSHFWAEGRDVLCRELIERFEMGDPLIDAGAGTGRFATELASEGRQIVWFDTHPLDHPGITASICAMPIQSGAAATVVARDVLEHVDHDAAMAEIARVLCSGGLGMITVPAWPSLWSERDELAGHLRRYRRRDLRVLAENHGLDVLEIRGYQFVLLPVVGAARWLARRRGAEVDQEESVPPLVNAAFRLINRTEGRLGRTAIGPPTGSSLVMIVRRP